MRSYVECDGVEPMVSTFREVIYIYLVTVKTVKTKTTAILNQQVSHIFTHLFITLGLYYEPTKWPAPSWLVSSVGGALHQYRRGHGFASRTRDSHAYETTIKEHYTNQNTVLTEPNAYSTREYIPRIRYVYGLIYARVPVIEVLYWLNSCID